MWCYSSTFDLRSVGAALVSRRLERVRSSQVTLRQSHYKQDSNVSTGRKYQSFCRRSEGVEI